MSLTDESNMIMPVSPMGNGNANGFGGDWGSWIILFLIFGMFSGNWGGFGGAANGAMGYDFPWLLNGQNGINANTNNGFAQAATQSAISGLQGSVTSGFGDVQTALCGGFAGVNASINNAQNAVAQQLYTNQIADLERSYAAQTANTQGMTALQGQLAQCCCDNRLATAQTQALVQSENCADRAALSEGLRDVITNQNAGIQKVLDTICQSQIEQKNDTIAQLRSELMYARGQASQDVQTAAIQAGQRALANEVEQYVAPRPIPSYPVQNPNCCSQNFGCGCGCGNF
jgi:hypothetical protein